MEGGRSATYAWIIQPCRRDLRGFEAEIRLALAWQLCRSAEGVPPAARCIVVPCGGWQRGPRSSEGVGQQRRIEGNLPPYSSSFGMMSWNQRATPRSGLAASSQAARRLRLSAILAPHRPTVYPLPLRWRRPSKILVIFQGSGELEGGRARGSGKPHGGRVDPGVARTDSQPQGPRTRTARGP